MNSFAELQGYLANYNPDQSTAKEELSDSSALDAQEPQYAAQAQAKVHVSTQSLVFQFNDCAKVVQTTKYKSKNKSKAPNMIANTHYTVLTFIPLILYNQFKYFFNMYFLIICISYFFPPLKVGFLFTYLCPLLLVLGFTMIKEGYDDIYRKRRDNEVNNEKYQVLDLKASQTSGLLIFRDVESRKLQQGDIIKLMHGKRIPADVILLCTQNGEKDCYIKSDQLDGETDFKLRKTTRFLSTYRLTAADLKAIFELYMPSKDMHELSGRLCYKDGDRFYVESLSLENAVFASCTLASSVECYGMICYSGCETKSSLNRSNPRIKLGILDKEIDKLTFVCFGIQLVLAIFFAFQSASPLSAIFYLNCFRFVLLFNAVIPISMRVNIEIAKIAYSLFISLDKHMTNCIVRSTTIPESLGRVNMLMSDKTGTITANKMIFYCLGTKSQPYNIKNQLLRALVGGHDVEELGFNAEMEPDLEAIREEYRRSYLIDDTDTEISSYQEVRTIIRRTKTGVSNQFYQKSVNYTQEKFQQLNQAIRSLALCNQIIPQKADSIDYLNSIKTKDEIISFNSPSPDEISFALFAAQCGYIMKERSDTLITFENPLGQKESIEILNIFPFSSRTKRMAIITREESQIVVYAKGADSVMLAKCQGGDRSKYNWVSERVDYLANQGLRTLVFGSRVLTSLEYERFLDVYSKAQASMTNRDYLVYQAEETIITNLDLNAVTGVEDLLQRDVKQSIYEIRKAGIKVFLLTGDKIETSKNIARSTGFINEAQSFFEVSMSQYEQYCSTRDSAAPQQIFHYITSALNSLVSNSYKDVLILDGQILQTIIDTIPAPILQKYNFQTLEDRKLKPPMLKNLKSPLKSDIADLFIYTAQNLDSMIVSRCSPEQKALVTKLISVTYKRGAKKPYIMAIGDGGNDVSMIQAADVGIGIRGQEGLQASLSADFSIHEFCDLRHLLFWHGRNSYIRSSNMSQFVMGRGITICIIQAVFSACFYYSSIPLFTGWLLLGYSVLYTSLPAVAVVLDTDVTRENVLTYPELYRENLKGRKCNIASFLKWFAISIFYGSVIGLLSNFVTGQDFYNIVGVSFSCLIVAELLTLGFGIKKWTVWMILSELASMIVYFASILCLPDVFDYQFVFSWKFWASSIVVTILAVLPCFVVKWVMECVRPDTVSKIRSYNRKDRKRKDYKKIFDIQDIM